MPKNDGLFDLDTIYKHHEIGTFLIESSPKPTKKLRATILRKYKAGYMRTAEIYDFGDRAATVEPNTPKGCSFCARTYPNRKVSKKVILTRVNWGCRAKKSNGKLTAAKVGFIDLVI